jgi:Rps23 Pro-64 3,4-dihydroxylase Tpa1-like proline 4-hydroxylase
MQISESDKIIRELRAREEDMNESIRSKDSQLAVLRVRFDELDNDLKSKKNELDSLRFESERLLKDHSNSSDLQSQVLDTLKDKLNELETNLAREKEAYAHAQVKKKRRGDYYNGHSQRLFMHLPEPS